MTPAKPEACNHRAPSTIAVVEYRWLDGELLNPQPTNVLCTGCGKQWIIGLTRPQRLRLMHLRTVGDKRSAYEVGPEILKRRLASDTK